MRRALDALRTLAAFLAGCLAAGIVQVAFAVRLSPLVAFGPDWLEQAGPTLALVAYAFALSAVFAAPFALVAIAAARWQDQGGAAYYATVGAAIGLGGFLAQWAGEVPGDPTIVNAYALTAYVVSGCAGGVAYWLLADYGRRRGVREANA